MGLMTWSFTASLAAIVYIYGGYPALMAVLAHARPRPVRKAAIRPSVTVIIPAHNEAGVIGAKIRNTLSLDYPRDRLRVVVVSDGSTDGTDAIVRRYESQRLRLLVQSRQGKAFALNRGARAASGEILVLTDANTILAPDAVTRLVENFADPRVGGVAGNKRHRPPDSHDGTARGESVYWRFDTWQKACESRAGNVFAADGALYAVRRRLYVPIEDPAQADDMAISMRIVLQGHRLVFEPGAVAFEEAPAERRREFARKVRVTNHSLRAVLNLRGKLWTSGFYSVQLLSHKFLRHLSPVLLLMLLASTIGLARSHSFFQPILAGQLALYGLGGLGLLLGRGTAPAGRWLVLPAYFCLVNLAALRGIGAVVRGRRLQVWTPRGDGRVEGPDLGRQADPVDRNRDVIGARVVRSILAALLLSPGPAAAQEATVPPPDQTRPSPTLVVALTVASIYDTNLDYVQSSLPSYGALAGIDARFQSRLDRPALLLDYTANIQSYSRTDKWDRVSQRGRLVLGGRLGSAWTVGLASSFSLLGATEDRELVDELVVGPRLEYWAGGSSIQVSGGQQLRRNQSGGLETKSDFAAVDLSGRLAGRHGWGASYRFETADSEDPQRRHVRSTYGAQYSRRMFTRGWLGVGLRYRAQQYRERMVHVDGEEVPRQDRGWQGYGTWVTNFRPGPELRLQYRYESRQSNVDWAEFDAHHLRLALRQPVSFGGAGRATRPEAAPAPAPAPVRPPAPGFTRSALGDRRACALTADGIAHCWSADAGAMDTTSNSAVSRTLRFSTIVLGPGHACALTGDGRPYCWEGDHLSVPTEVRTKLRFASLTAGSEHVCALTSGGQAYCWGDNRTGALGSPSRYTFGPVPVTGGHRFRLVAAGSHHTCGLTGDGTPYCWGANQHGELGGLFASGGSIPALVTGGHRFSGLSAGTTHTCGVTPEGEAYCWGANTWGQLGTGSTVSSRAPAGVAGELAFTDVAAGVDHTCGLTRHGELYCWGRNDRGQLGSESDAPVQTIPVRAGGGVRYKSVVAFRGTCGITIDGELRCWGVD